MIVILEDLSLLQGSLLIDRSWKSLYFLPIREWYYTKKFSPLSQAKHFQAGEFHHNKMSRK